MTSFVQAYQRALFQPVVPVIWGVMSIFGIVAGPFGTLQSISLGMRCLYWPVIIGLGVLVGAVLRVLVDDYMGLRRYTAEAPLLALFSALLLTPPFWWLTDLVASDRAAAPEVSEMALYVFVASMAVSTLRHAFNPNSDLLRMWTEEEGGAALPDLEAEAAAPPTADEGGPRLAARLPEGDCGPIVRLQVRDHYVEVITPTGRRSLLMRFADAVAEMEGVEGLQVHRSHWVARAAIRALVRRRGKVRVVMCDGSEVPVSRTYLPQVEALELPPPEKTGA